MGDGGVIVPLFLTLFFAVGFGMLGYGGHSYYYAKQAAHWPTTPGKITASNFEVDSDSDGTTYNVKIRYSYSVNGQNLEGKRIAFGYSGSSLRNFHKEIHDALPVGTGLAVRYDPSKPSRAALSFGVNQSIIFILIFGATWTAFMIGFAAIFLVSGGGAGSLLSNMLIYDRP